MTARFTSTVSAWLRLGPAPMCHDSLLILLAMRACKAAVLLLMVVLVLPCTSTRRRPRATERARAGKKQNARGRARAQTVRICTVLCTCSYLYRTYVGSLGCTYCTANLNPLTKSYLHTVPWQSGEIYTSTQHYGSSYGRGLPYAVATPIGAAVLSPAWPLGA